MICPSRQYGYTAWRRCAESRIRHRQRREPCGRGWV